MTSQITVGTRVRALKNLGMRRSTAPGEHVLLGSEGIVIDEVGREQGLVQEILDIFKERAFWVDFPQADGQGRIRHPAFESEVEVIE